MSSWGNGMGLSMVVARNVNPGSTQNGDAQPVLCNCSIFGGM